MPQTAWITGASGFIGGHLVSRLKQAGWRVIEMRCRAEWADSPAPGDMVFHLGGIAHRRATSVDALMTANCQLTVDLYRRAQRVDCQGFIFLSTAKVLGDGGAMPFASTAPRRPHGAYAESKTRAEERLLAMHDRGGPPLAIVRPPLVYGPGAKANFRLLARSLALGLPLPFADAYGKRSFVSVVNLADALATIGAALPDRNEARVWHVADGEDIDVATLCRALASKFGRQARLWPVPRSLFDAAARLSGGFGISRDLVASLFEPFQLDDSALREELGWSPPQTLDAALEQTAAWFSDRHPASGSVG